MFGGGNGGAGTASSITGSSVTRAGGGGGGADAGGIEEVVVVEDGGMLVICWTAGTVIQVEEVEVSGQCYHLVDWWKRSCYIKYATANFSGHYNRFSNRI
jgi:hypothetical protein